MERNTGTGTTPGDGKTHTHWLLTVNNPEESDDVDISRAREKGWLVEGQKEKGKDGTEHYQIYVRSKQRFSALKKAFPRAHIEVCHNPDAARQYVKKEDTRIGCLPAEARNKPMSMWQVMILLANNAPYRDYYGAIDEIVEDAFWKSVNSILETRPGMISLLVQPNYIRAWRYTANIWLEHAQNMEYDEEELPLTNEIIEYQMLDDDTIEINCPYCSYETKHPDECICTRAR